jgi:amino acid adenylation domain-containing protein
LRALNFGFDWRTEKMNSSNTFHPLSESQKSIWYLEKAYPGTSINIVAGTLRLKGEISYAALEKALNIFVRKSDAMRLRIHETGGSAVQYVTEYEELKLDFLDFSGGDGLKDLFEWDEDNTRTPFNINDRQLFYCAVFKVSADEGGFYMKMHHLISDAWTMGLVTRQVIDFYSKIKNGEPVDETANPSFIEHLVGEAAYEKSARFENDKAYWLQKFETLPEMTVIKARKFGGESIRAKRKTLITPLKLSNKIREFCLAHRVSVFTLFMSALAIYINRVTGLDDLILGTTILNRTSAREKETPGMFVSVAAPVRIAVDDSADFIAFSKSMIKEATDVLRHQKYPYNYLIRDLKRMHKFTGRLFDIVLTYQNSKFHKNETDADYTAKWLFSGFQVESLIISINDREDGGNLIIDYDFLTDVFDIKEIEFIHQHVISLLWHALDNPSRSISRLEMISEREKQTILRDFNNTYADYPKDKTIHQMFEAQAENSGDRVALVFGDATMTYRELNYKANRLALTLRNMGVGPDKIVGIMAHRSFEMIVGILGILKAGGAYLPIDPDYPKERREFMFRDSGAVLLLTQEHLLGLADFEGRILSLDNTAVYSGKGLNLPPVNMPRDLAYVIYTSGSTGLPKGVMIEHTGVVNSFCWGVRTFSLDESSVILQKTAPTFDPSVWEIFWWLMLGGKLCLIDSGEEKDPEAIITAVEEHGVTAMHFVPSMMSVFLSYVEATGSAPRLKSLKQVFSCGEAISVSQVRHFNSLLREANDTRLYNMYGPTEATVEVSSFDCSQENELNTVPIGARIDNFSVYILDRNRNLLPVGVPGEIYISGAGVGRGYLGNRELTAERFIWNPYVPGKKMYRTGDKARWYPKGDIEFLGRMDYQIKIKGYRIEPGEIEARLLSNETVLEAVVKDFKDDAGITFLAAYIVAPEGIEAVELRAFLQDKLPEYMVPACFVFLENMPKNANGKVDRSALRKPEYSGSVSAEYIAPADDTEKALAGIWQEVLGIEYVGVLDDYTSAGGDSLKAIMIITAINKKWGIEVSPKEIFSTKNVRELASLIKNSSGTGYTQIPIAPESAWYPVSSAQKRQYILNEMEGGTRYNLPGILVMEGKVDAGRIGDVFREIIARHESLRTSFALREGEPVQHIHRDVEFGVDYAEENGADEDRLMTEFITPFNLGTPPLMRVKLVKTGEFRYALLFDMHHIISDGASINILFDEIVNLYEKRSRPKLRVQYKDYAIWHNGRLKSKKILRQETYWLEKFSGEIPVLNMPTDFPRPAFQSYRGKKLRFAAGEALTQALKLLTKRSGTTLFAVLLSSYNVLLSKYCGQDDIIVGTAVEGRQHDELRDLIGMFVNTLALRCKPAGDKTFKAFLTEVAEELYNAYDNNEYPFEVLVEKAGVRRDISRNPLFDTMFIMQNMDMATLQTDDFVAHPYVFDNRTSKFDLSVEAFDRGKTIEFTLEYCTDLFREETVRRLSIHFLNALGDIVQNPSKKLSQINILSEAERRQLLYAFNDTDTDYPQDKTIQQIFEEQAANSPENTALVFRDKKMTYRELNERSNGLARALRAVGVGPESIVGLMVGRSFDMVVSILGVLKAGGAYMPIDPDYPAERKAYMLQDSGAKVLLTGKDFGLPAHFEGTISYLEDVSALDADVSNLPNSNKSSDLAHIIYTSGSTGYPKGVMTEHRNVVGLFRNRRYTLDFKPSDIWTFFHSYCFDLGLWEMYGALLFGGRLVLIPSDAVTDINEYHRIITDEKVTVLVQTPQLLYRIIDMETESALAGLSIRIVCLGGEELNPALLKPLKSRYPHAVFNNLYGPTETTMYVTQKEFVSEEELDSSISNIGKPIPLTKVFIVDKYLNLSPVGVPGELCVSGNGLGRGYINKPQLTSEKFVANPFCTGELMYKTGDLARRMACGEIEYLGRIDDQVKVRGYRIEPGEIENAILKYQKIKEATVIVHTADGGHKKLCAYYTSETAISPHELSAFLSSYLPDYMIPSFFIRLEEMPLTRNGKLDARRLPEPTAGPDNNYIAPAGPTEKSLTELWRQVLKHTKISAADNFFYIGGDSLSAVAVSALVRKHLQADISARDIFSHKTIQELGAYIDTLKKSSYTPIPRIPKSVWYPMSAAQKRQYVEYRLYGGASFHVTSGILIDGILDVRTFRDTFRKIIQRQESLRTCFRMADSQPVQVIQDEVDFDIEETNTDQTDVDKLMSCFVRPFDLSEAPLFRAQLVHFSDDKHLLMLDMHHIISDGTSMNIFMKEFIEIFYGKELPELKIQYKDYSAWHNDALKSNTMRKQESYWLNRLSGELPLLNMPLDFSRPPMKSLEGNRVFFTIGKELTKEIRALVSFTETTLYTVLLSAYIVLLSKYTGQEDIIVGMTVEGRNHPDLRDIIGMFVNTPVIRGYPVGEKTFRVFLNEVKEELLNINDNQDYPFEELVAKLGLKEDPGRGPLFDTMFTLQNVVTSTLTTDDFSMELYNYNNRTSKTDLSIGAFDHGDTIPYFLDYRTVLFNAETMELFVKQFENVLWEIVRNPLKKLSDIDPHVKQNLVYFNEKKEKCRKTRNKKLEPSA